jgi:hypothetical protein
MRPEYVSVVILGAACALLAYSAALAIATTRRYKEACRAYEKAALRLDDVSRPGTGPGRRGW